MLIVYAENKLNPLNYWRVPCRDLAEVGRVGEKLRALPYAGPLFIVRGGEPKNDECILAPKRRGEVSIRPKRELKTPVPEAKPKMFSVALTMAESGEKSKFSISAFSAKEAAAVAAEKANGENATIVTKERENGVQVYKLFVIQHSELQECKKYSPEKMKKKIEGSPWGEGYLAMSIFGGDGCRKTLRRILNGERKKVKPITYIKLADMLFCKATDLMESAND